MGELEILGRRSSVSPATVGDAVEPLVNDERIGDDASCGLRGVRSDIERAWCRRVEDVVLNVDLAMMLLPSRYASWTDCILATLATVAGRFASVRMHLRQIIVCVMNSSVDGGCHDLEMPNCMWSVRKFLETMPPDHFRVCATLTHVEQKGSDLFSSRSNSRQSQCQTSLARSRTTSTTPRPYPTLARRNGSMHTRPARSNILTCTLMQS